MSVDPSTKTADEHSKPKSARRSPHFVSISAPKEIDNAKLPSELVPSSQETDFHNLSGVKVTSVIPRKRQQLLKWNGWGYKDSQFSLKENRTIEFTGNRYELGGKELPFFYPWVIGVFDLDMSHRRQPIPPPRPQDLPPSNLTRAHREQLADICEVSTDHMDRLIRSHGQTLHEVAALRLTGREASRLPDAVVWPKGHSDAERLVALAGRLRLALVPLGGATSVSGALAVPAEETRPVIVVDTTSMNSILWIDEESLVACCQSGIVGQDLERELRAKGYTVGHEPDSYEFSTLGGWVATRASGMKKNRYGNIEEVVIAARMVTAKGTLQRAPNMAPRISAGPDQHNVTLGSEGTLGIITEVLVKIRPKPPVTRYGSLVFPSLQKGLECLREVARRRIQPASIRLMDNEQFRFGQSLKTEKSYGGVLLDGIKKFYLTKIKGFDLQRMVVATLLFEGREDEVKLNQREIEEIAMKCEGIPAGAENGRAGYILTFVIAYIRDLGLEYGIVAESFETSVCWSRARMLCERVKSRLAAACVSRSITHYLASCRITQTYDSGCCIYFYFAFNGSKCADPIVTYDDIEREARDEIILAGGSISHHHGVGKLRQRWYERTVSEPGLRILRAAKRALDPDNIFALGNLSKDISKPLPEDIPQSRL